MKKESKYKKGLERLGHVIGEHGKKLDRSRRNGKLQVTPPPAGSYRRHFARRLDNEVARRGIAVKQIIAEAAQGAESPESSWLQVLDLVNVGVEREEYEKRGEPNDPDRERAWDKRALDSLVAFMQTPTGQQFLENGIRAIKNNLHDQNVFPIVKGNFVGALLQELAIRYAAAWERRRGNDVRTIYGEPLLKLYEMIYPNNEVVVREEFDNLSSIMGISTADAMLVVLTSKIDSAGVQGSKVIKVVDVSASASKDWRHLQKHVVELQRDFPEQFANAQSVAVVLRDHEIIEESHLQSGSRLGEIRMPFGRGVFTDFIRRVWETKGILKTLPQYRPVDDIPFNTRDLPSFQF